MSHSPFPWITHPQAPTNVYDADGMKVSASLGPNAEDNAALIAAIPAMIEALQEIKLRLSRHHNNPATSIAVREANGNAAWHLADAVLASIGKKP